MRKYKAYIFDLDGTLVNSFENLSIIFKKAMDSIGYDYDESYTLVFSRNDFKQGFRLIKLKVNKNQLRQFARIVYDELKKEDALKKSILFEDTKDTLIKIKNSGAKIAICTMNQKDHVLRLLKYLDLDFEMFDAIVCHNDTKKQKPHPAPIKCALKKLELKPSEDVVYIGDAINDIKAGKRAHISTILVERFSEYKNYKDNKIVSLNELI